LARPETVLEVRGLGAGYGRKQVLFDIDLELARGEIVSVLGHNGAGKTTLLKAVYGLLPAMSGEVVCCGAAADGARRGRGRMAGAAFMPSERFVFGDLTVAENLEVSLRSVPRSRDVSARLRFVHDLLPLLRERAGQKAGSLSGGQQRMVSLGMALVGEPQLLLLDEPSLGLAPVLVREIFAKIRSVVDGGSMATLLVEQNVPAALQVCDRVVVLRSGRLIAAETSAALHARGPQAWWDLF
jgi:branched-chain amino acid transport system ATP-binding protein